MEQRMIVTIGYAEYAVPVEDATALLRIAMRSPRVKRTGYSRKDHWYLDADETGPFATDCRIGNFGEAPDPEFPAPSHEGERIEF